MNRFSLRAVFVLCALALLVASPSRALIIVGLNADDNLFTFDAQDPRLVASGVFVTGLQPSEHLLAIDAKPSNGVLYGIGSSSRLYAINLSNGAAFAVGNPANSFAPQLSGTSFGFDIDPVSDTARVVSNTGQNLKIDLNTGSCLTNASPVAGLDADSSGRGYEVINSQYAQLNLSTGLINPLFIKDLGQSFALNNVDGETFIRDIAVIPEPGTLSLVGLGLLGLMLRRSIGGCS